MSAVLIYTSLFWVKNPKHISVYWLHVALRLLNKGHTKVSSRAASSERWKTELAWVYDLVLLAAFLTFLTKNYKFVAEKGRGLLLSNCSFPLWMYSAAIVEPSRPHVFLIIGIIITKQCIKNSMNVQECSALQHNYFCPNECEGFNSTYSFIPDGF